MESASIYKYAQTEYLELQPEWEDFKYSGV